MLKIIIMGMAIALFSALILKIYLDTFMNRAGSRKEILGWLPFYIWQYLSETGCFPEHITLAITFLTTISVSFIAYNGNPWKLLVFPVVYLAVWMALEGAVDFGVRYLSGELETGFLMISIPSKLLLLVVVLGIRQFARKQGVGKEPYRGELYFIVLPITGMLLYHTIYRLLHGIYTNRPEAVIYMMAVAFALIFLNLSFYPGYSNLVRDLHIRKNAYFYMKQMELFIQEKERDEAAERESRERNHNIKHHLIYLDELIEHGKLETARETLKGLIGEADRRGMFYSRTGNIVVDSMVNHAWKTAQESGIIFHGDLCPLPDLSIKDGDLCVLLGNILDNALEASVFMQDGRKEIWVSLNYTKGCLFLLVKNRYEGDIKLSEDGKIPSRKKGNAHGFGLYSMQRIVDKYHGRLWIKLDDDEGIFTVEILIHC